MFHRLQASQWQPQEPILLTTTLRSYYKRPPNSRRRYGGHTNINNNNNKKVNKATQKLLEINRKAKQRLIVLLLIIWWGDEKYDDNNKKINVLSKIYATCCRHHRRSPVIDHPTTVALDHPKLLPKEGKNIVITLIKWLRKKRWSLDNTDDNGAAAGATQNMIMNGGIWRDNKIIAAQNWRRMNETPVASHNLIRHRLLFTDLSSKNIFPSTIMHHTSAEMRGLVVVVALLQKQFSFPFEE